VTASAALEEGVWSPDDVVDAGSGFIRFGARQIDDMHSYGMLRFTDVFVKSSNIGAIRIGLKVGRERLGRYVRRFGFGTRLSPDFPSETSGIVWDPAKWDDSALASVAMGYQIGVTPLQMAVAVSSVANGGNLVEPRLARAIIKDGMRREVRPRVIRRTIGRSTAAELTTIMEQVVTNGTARAAAVHGYQVAGKTGTAQKLINGNYSHTNYNASFVGFVPSRNPVLTIIVVIESPHAIGYTGGVIAAPVFKRIAEASLHHLSVPPTLNPTPPILVARGAAQVDAEVAIRPVADTQGSPVEVVAGVPTMPDLRGLSAREATRKLAQLGVTARLRGIGVVANQEPPAGVPLEGVASCLLVLNRTALVAGAFPGEVP
jgi:cell division protein FtsI/penicillin-binding protein 2